MSRVKEVKLDALGQKIETALGKMLDEISKVDMALPPEARPTLLDKLRVMDRVLKWQSVKLKVEDDEGGFFNGLADDEEPEEEPPRGKKGNGNGRSAKGSE